MSIRADASSTETPGRVAAAAAETHSKNAGWRTLARAVTWREGALDLISLDQETLVFSSVFTIVAGSESQSAQSNPARSPSRRKRMRQRLLARRWICDELPKVRVNDSRINAIRFDAFVITVTKAGQLVELVHREDAF